MKIEWKDSYSLGDALIDQQHRELFALANAMLQARDQDTARLCAVRLYKHVREHFAAEEALMAQFGFPEYQHHVELHNDMLDRLNTISQSIARNQINGDALANFIYEWALRHIPSEDARLATFMKKIS